MLKIEQVPLQQKKALEIINSLKDVQFLDISRNSWLSDSLLDELGKNFKKLKYLNISKFNQLTQGKTRLVRRDCNI